MTTDLIPNDQDLARMERQLFDRIELDEREEEVANHPRRRGVWIAASAAAALVVTSVLANGFGLFGTAGASASAAGLLHRASADASSATQPVIPSGQYLEVLIREIAQTSEIPDSHSSAVWWMQKQTIAVFYPADGSSAPTEARVNADPADVHGDTAGRRILESQWATATSKVATVSSSATNVNFWTQTRHDIAALPITTGALLTSLRNGGNDDDAWQRANELLMSGLLTSDQRALMYDTLATLPGVDVTQQDANLDGQPGTALGRSINNGLRDEIIIDATTGAFLGNRTVVASETNAANAPHQPVGTVVRWSAITQAIVDTIPDSAQFTAQYGGSAGAR